MPAIERRLHNQQTFNFRKILKAVPHIGGEDREELIQNTAVIAAQMLIRTYAQKKEVAAIKESVAAIAVECLGEDALADSTRKPRWFGDLHAEREWAACRVH